MIGDDLDRGAVGDEQRSMGVAQVVEPDPWQAAALRDAVEELADRFGVEEPAGGGAEQPVVGPTRQTIASELSSPPPEFVEGRAIEVDAEAGPFEPDDLTSAHPSVGGEVQRGVEPLASGGGRNVLVRTRWTDHLDAVAAELQQRGVESLVLNGGLGKRARATVIGQLNADSAPTGQLLLATDSYLGEGFDSPSLDTLFLAFPLAFTGRVVQ